MAELKNCYLICYDIRCQKRWRKAYKLLEGYGERIQYSIFRCWLNQRTREKLRWELEKILTTEDAILFLRLSNRCLEDIHKYNRPSSWPHVQEPYLIV
ncbi:CRISPR-associated protein Cas2 [Scytonema hofmannii PCC 7110]|jgi:CRISPR-associated protein Cas2|uniref:CRISPR-associated endoribonuclease Cas2 n=1 Tax=Scytonema hofmannii PCC 7110 TaxID=128403 RepID=A0A139XGP3_9CYAN|nr:CRISPR-associated endonuclease Cas2 [Scytonema hofmannii]KYC43864.1 CRISPR-associated protein Cas2 [Scytonema hofmannii PCC 7110]